MRFLNISKKENTRNFNKEVSYSNIWTGEVLKIRFLNFPKKKKENNSWAGEILRNQFLNFRKNGKYIILKRSFLVQKPVLKNCQKIRTKTKNSQFSKKNSSKKKLSCFEIWAAVEISKNQVSRTRPLGIRVLLLKPINNPLSLRLSLYLYARRRAQSLEETDGETSLSRVECKLHFIHSTKVISIVITTIRWAL